MATYGIGYETNGTVVELSSLEVPLQPFESKIIKLVVFNEEPTSDIVDISATIEEILDITDVRVSTTNTSPSTWNRTTSLVQVDPIYPLYVYITNKYYCESLVNINLEYKQYKSPTTTMSYYGDLTKEGTNDLYYLPRDIEVKTTRVFTINPAPAGATYTYLSYSHGNHLVLLDNNSGIIVQPN